MFNFKEYLGKIEEYATGEFTVGGGNTVGTHNDGPGSGFAGAGGMSFLPTHWTGTETLQNKLASLDGVIQKSLDHLDLNQGALPLIKKETRIMYLKKENNPIYAHLEDGTRLFFTRGEWERCGKPEVGHNICVVMQRRPNDNSDKPSQVQYCQRR